MKRFLTLTMAAVLLLCILTFNVSAQEGMSVYIDGQKIQFDINPQIINGRTMVPMRKIFEELGATVDWEQETQTITGKKDDTIIVMKINNNKLLVNDEILTLDVVPTIIDGRTLVPVRAIAESLGVDVLWYGDIQTVAIYTNQDLIEKKSLYNLKGDSVEVDTNFEQQYVFLGWSPDIKDIETVCVYAPDGRSKYVHIGDVADEVAVGWSTEPVVIMYALDGRTQAVKKEDVEANKKVGWYETKEEVTETLYSITGPRYVYKAEVQSYLNQGWRKWPLPITATNQCSFEENSVNGIKLCWLARNTSGKTINYYHVKLYFINAVGDPAYDEITHKNSKIVNYVGPVNPNEELCIYSIVGYVPVCDKVLIGEVELEYADGTTETVWCGQVAKEGSILSKWDGTMMYK